MNDNINKKLQNILSGSKINGQNLSSFLNSAEADKLKNSLSQEDKQKILNAFSGISAEEMKKKLSQANINSISKLSANEIINRLKKF